MLVWCESVQSCVTVPPQLEDCGAHMWSVSVSAYPRAGTRVIAVSHTVRSRGMLEALQSEFVAVAVK